VAGAELISDGGDVKTPRPRYGELWKNFVLTPIQIVIGKNGITKSAMPTYSMVENRRVKMHFSHFGQTGVLTFNINISSPNNQGERREAAAAEVRFVSD